MFYICPIFQLSIFSFPSSTCAVRVYIKRLFRYCEGLHPYMAQPTQTSEVIRTLEEDTQEPKLTHHHFSFRVSKAEDDILLTPNSDTH